MRKSPGDLPRGRDEATGLQLASAACEYLHQVSGEDSFAVAPGFSLSVAKDTGRRRALVFTSGADHAVGDTALARAIGAVVEGLGRIGIPKDRILVTGHLRWSPKGQFPREFAKVLDGWLSETAPDRVRELNEAFVQEIRDKGN